MKTLVLLSLLCLSSCTVREPLHAFKPRSGAQELVELGLGRSLSLSSTWTRLVADGEQVCEETYLIQMASGGTGRSVLSRQRVVAPTPQKWSAFWTTVERLKLKQWKGKYSPEELGMSIHDGTQWTMEIVSAGVTTKANGDNVYPARGRPWKPTLSDAALVELREAFNTLLDSP